MSARRQGGRRTPEPVSRPGTVSVVLVNYRGAKDAITCLRAFDEVD